MSNAYVIEVYGKTAGIIVRHTDGGAGYRFLSASQAFNNLEGLDFDGPNQAERAARALASISPRGVKRVRSHRSVA
jgi:hypothetical protein